MSWTEDQINHAQSYEGTVKSAASIAEEMELSDDEVEELMLDADLERCPECEWWCRCGDLLDDNDDAGACSSCRQYH